MLDAIDARDWPGLAEELGDFMLQAVFFAQMASEAGHFRIEDALDAINKKLIRRHPHIFGELRADTADDVKKRWDEIKAEEKKEKGEAAQAAARKHPRSLPALVEARTSAPAPQAPALIGKMPSRSRETRRGTARTCGSPETASQEEIEGEIGDLLFVLVNLARFMKVDPEQALRKSNANSAIASRT